MKPTSQERLAQAAVRVRDMMFAPGITVQGKNEAGVLTGGTFHCRLEGCNGLRVSVKWPDGKRTYPCTKGMEFKSESGRWVIK